MAKSRLAGVQFDALFTDNLYFDLSKHAINKAMQLRQLFAEANIPIKDSPTNQQFVTLSHQQMEYLKSKILFETWEPVDETHSLCRFVTSWATTDEDMNLLSEALKQL